MQPASYRAVGLRTQSTNWIVTDVYDVTSGDKRLQGSF